MDEIVKSLENRVIMLESEVRTLANCIETLMKFSSNQLEINDMLRDLVLEKYSKEELDEFLVKKKAEKVAQK